MESTFREKVAITRLVALCLRWGFFMELVPIALNCELLHGC